MILAQDRVGGRIWTVPDGDHVVELGAQWIHGEVGNSLFDFSSARGLIDTESVSYEAEGLFYTSSGEQLNNDIVDRAQAVIRKAYDQCSKFSREPEESWKEKLPSSVGAFFRKKFLEQFEIQNSLHEGLWNWLMLYEKIDNACDSMYELSALSWGEWSDCDGEWHVNLKNGYSSVITALLDSLKPGVHSLNDEHRPILRLREPVDSIHWMVDMDNATSESNPHYSLVEVHAASGKVYCATHVIVTVSLGVLKEHLDSWFKPDLPARMRLAIKSLGFGVIDKIFVTFPFAFWEKDCRGIHLVWTEPEEEGSTMADNWVRGITGFDPVIRQPCTLVCWLGGEEARFMETLSEEKIKEALVALLRKFCADLNVPDPVRILR
ncbi:unnamed protein product [Notodromas monacha]|uniref:Amine oxidase domain-containing protein n=1 Tax=Notodromas monacha TaxID=399045 RepID=A0A7R9BHL5_9CRUS|nr:unnamed protein product [Notodromas monacha]CAG0914238.1 unnamed protein product [Notodromas monacha]